ncbi:very short patch repair endonuclease [Alkanindiges hydrocarboniclasticus]|uniref:Very short patch repair endonuclease n=1 Tax=Alkanindiges hydrocarboniclasticus TaxID=1907941 RepID=A0A1S8CYY1_9GAMM|nr:DNA mismatch endonuclease Vsr [Alkanindiges hydrocarboniclasticus]ONG41804.1 very short patch repair endonuclease [Alkanindiges hydrocarboniclasticus]
MADIVDSASRSRMMAGIRNKNTKPEIKIRRALHAKGFRYRLHDTRLPGKPDLVLPRYRAVIQVQGCFWHAHDCALFKLPATRTEFWRQKIGRNQERDRQNTLRLLELGWRVLIWWECNTRNSSEFEEAIETVIEWLRTNDRYLEIG